MNRQSISILGCGWLGLPLGARLVSEGFSVKGSVTSQEKFDMLKASGIKPYEVRITDHNISADNLSEFLNSDILIINFPPSRREDIVLYHTAQFRQLIDALRHSSVRHVLLISSTSVYPDVNREVYETETAAPAKGSGQALKQVEGLLMNESVFKTTVLRFAGLIGYDRMPGRFLAGKKNVENGDAPVNLIHRDDCIEIIYQIISQSVWGEVFNACSDNHPTRREYYVAAAKEIGMEPPTFTSGTPLNFKIINSDKIRQRLKYIFKYPDPMQLLKM